MNERIAVLGEVGTLAGRQPAHGALRTLGLLTGALGFSWLLGCAPNTPLSNLFTGGSSGSNTPQYMAIASNGSIQLYTLPDPTTGVSGAAPTSVQGFSVPNVLSVAIDKDGNLLYLASDAANNLNADFFVCEANVLGDEPGLTPVEDCNQVGGTIPGGQWLAVDFNRQVFATSLGATAGTVVSFAENAGPGAAMTTVYTSAVEPVYYGGLAVDRNDTVYVTEQNAEYGGDSLFSCSSTCAQTPGSQTDVTAALTGQVTNGAAGGPLAIGEDGNTLYIGGADAGPPYPATLPLAITCIQGNSGSSSGGSAGLACTGSSVTFPLLDSGSFNPFVSSAGIAADASGNTYNAVLLSDYGQPGANVGPLFYGFQDINVQFTCSGSNQATCPVNLLPAPPVDTQRGNYPYGIAVGVSGNQLDSSSSSSSGG